MPAVRLLRPDTFFPGAEWRAVTRVSKWRGVWLVAHAWLVIVAAAGIAAWLDHVLAWLAAIVIIGGRQLGLAILMHDAAHGLLHPKRSLNNFLGEWLTGAPVGSDLLTYRTYHLQHHKFTQQPEDPDLGLSAAFPTTRASLLRKVARDLSGITFFRQRTAQILFSLKGKRSEAGRPEHSARKAVLRFLIVNALLLALSLLLWGWTPFLLWLAGLATTFQMFLRIRNIAEHACTTTGSDDPFSHARTTRAGWLARATVAPYWVNYHSEHHLFMGVPCYRLAEVHRRLGDADYHGRMTLAPNYLSILRKVTAAG